MVSETFNVSREMACIAVDTYLEKGRFQVPEVALV
jgi:hypothetical protein